MRVETRVRGMVAGEPLLEHVRRHAGFALGRFAEAVSAVEVRLVDHNGPKGGTDKSCLVRVRAAGFTVLLEERDASIEAAVARAMERADRAVARQLSRRAWARPRLGLRGARADQS